MTEEECQVGEDVTLPVAFPKANYETYANNTGGRPKAATTGVIGNDSCDKEKQTSSEEPKLQRISL